MMNPQELFESHLMMALVPKALDEARKNPRKKIEVSAKSDHPSVPNFSFTIIIGE